MYAKAAKMAMFSSLVYRDFEGLNKGLLKLGFKDWSWFDREGTQAFILVDSTDIVICFRGTEPDKMTDVMSDLKAWPKRSQEKGLVHFGFAEALDKVYSELKLHIQYLRDRNSSIDYNLVCTGHSLGGALATLCASRLDANEVYTFGSPRVGSRSFCKEMRVDNIQHYRFVNNNDIVTAVPFWIMGYRHYGNLEYINHYGNIRKMTFWQRIKDKLRGRRAAWKNKQPFDGVRDHDINSYVKKIYNVSVQSKK
jgi:triacylglycerol lipase